MMIKQVFRKKIAAANLSKDAITLKSVLSLKFDDGGEHYIEIRKHDDPMLSANTANTSVLIGEYLTLFENGEYALSEKTKKAIIDKHSSTEAEIEQEIQGKGLNAPRLTPELIDKAIAKAKFHVFEGSCLTVCCLTLKNGFTVTGESACASPENFNAEIGEKIAFEQARDKVWMLEGYLLKEKLFNGELTND